jgi:O-methyltransferase involved in polyketide biosynthesis
MASYPFSRTNCSVAWVSNLRVCRLRPFLFLGEGVFMYFETAQVRSLVLSLMENFPGAELVLDVFSPFLVRANNLRLSLIKFGARYGWGLKRGRDLENWGEGIRLLREWFPLDYPEPRLAHIRWMRHIQLLTRVIGIFHYQLGKIAV